MPTPNQSRTALAQSSIITLTAEQRDHCRPILDFWHKVEFFIPFDLDGQVLEARDADWAVRQLSWVHLNALPPHSCGDLWQVARVPDGKQLSGFELYLGVFDKSLLGEITQTAARKIISSTLSDNEESDQTERADLDGKTCFAKIKLTAKGEPLLNEVSVSTAPWALGRVLDGGLASLDFDLFQTSLDRLQEDLQNFKAARSPAQSSESAENATASEDSSERPLTRSELEALLQVFYAWAGFTPDASSKAIIVIRARVSPASKPKHADTTDTGLPNASAAKLSEAPTSQTAVPRDDEDEEGDCDRKAEIEILNSFYAKDIQRVIQALDRGQINAALLAYLTPLIDEHRIDLYTQSGRERILADLHPRLTPRAHWLGEPEHAMSLMQQLAINNTFQSIKTSGLFSVNGPPGTGKTTLLRDLFADNITRRALVLANYDNAADVLCLDSKLKVEFDGVDGHCSISPLKPEVTGFEMIVASSNNAAVENISRDLPKTKALGSIKKNSVTGQATESAWRNADGSPKHTYLQPVAHRLAAQNHKGEFEFLDSDDTPWGMISAALGNRTNRRAFVNGISLPPQKAGESPPKGYDPKKHQSIWQWREKYQGLSFGEAKKVLLNANNAVAHRQKELIEVVKIHTEIDGHTQTTFVQREMQTVTDAQRDLQSSQTEYAQLDQALRTCLSRLDGLAKIKDSLHQDQPTWWKRWFKRAEYTAHQAQLADNRQAQRQAIHEKIDLEPRADHAKNVLTKAQVVFEAAQTTLTAKNTRWTTLHTLLSKLRTQFPKAAQPTTSDELETREWQRQGIWYDEELNGLRSALFAAALNLQQAWLADVLQKGKGNGPFSQNLIAICHMLKGKRLVDHRHALVIWQSLFMLVPVISSTFASIANQFCDLEANALGWLFIDEAGQTVPQAAVGALWRCQRAVVVGDPMQIEPVFTVPIKLIEALATTSKLSDDANVKPHKVSAQNLADAANALGTWVEGAGGSDQWIGSPLRVHRRCVEPMFGVANTIAYDGKMVYGLGSEYPPVDALDLGTSAWVHIAGQAIHKQVVPEQVELVLVALVGLYQSFGELPPIYIISPFKEIKKDLIERIANLDHWRSIAGGFAKLPRKTVLRDWCREHIGTVHTFQGKEQSIVWMVLGCDKSTEGAANWASDKPNLLNVAITRAQHRFFLIGDINLWGGKPFFQKANPRLPTISPQEFQQRMLLKQTMPQEVIQF